MKLHSSIQPRADGTLVVEGFGKPLEFVADEEGFLSCDVTNETAVAALLATGDFYPADPEDFEHAVALSTPAQADGTGDEHDEDDDHVNPNALPLEANTPPKA